MNWHQFLDGPKGIENARFGSAIAALSDINMDGFNDVIIGSPLENHNSGAVYIYNGHGSTIRRRYSQVIHEFHGDVFAYIIMLQLESLMQTIHPIPLQQIFCEPLLYIKHFLDFGDDEMKRTQNSALPRILHSCRRGRVKVRSIK